MGWNEEGIKKGKGHLLATAALWVRKPCLSPVGALAQGVRSWAPDFLWVPKGLARPGWLGEAMKA